MTFSTVSKASLLRRSALCGLLLSLAACSNVDRVVTGSTIPDDFRQRHAIVLTNAPQTLDIFVGGAAGLDKRQARDVSNFATDYLGRGQGTMTILVPASQGPAAQHTLHSVRTTLAAAGVKGHVNVGSYAPPDPTLAAPLRLSFVSLQAQAATRCGEWPADLASGSSMKGWDNRPYYNLGCATQQNLAAQIADPRDLVRPRVEEPADVQMRTRAIGNVREGVDPGTSWRITNSNNIGTVGQ